MIPIPLDYTAEIRSNATIQHSSAPFYTYEDLGCKPSDNECYVEKIRELNSYWNSPEFPQDAREFGAMIAQVVFMAFLIWSNCKKSKKKIPFNIFLFGYSFIILLRTVSWFLRYAAQYGLPYSTNKKHILFTVSLYRLHFFNYFYLLITPAMSFEISLKVQFKWTRLPTVLLLVTILLSILFAWITDNSQDIITPIYEVYNWDRNAFLLFLIGKHNLAYFLPLFVTVMTPIVSHLFQKKFLTEKFSSQDLAMLAMVILTGVLYTIPIAITYGYIKRMISSMTIFIRIDDYHYVPEVFFPIANTIWILLGHYKKEEIAPTVPVKSWIP